MKKLNELEKLTQTIRENMEVIVFTEGFEGKIFLDYLRYTGVLPHISCIAAEKIYPLSNPNKMDHFLPIIPLEKLPHFKETALFVVAVNEERLETVKEMLKNFGCKRLYIFTKTELRQAQNVLKRLVKEGAVLNWKINNIISELENMKLLVTKQNEVSEVNTKAFAEYRDAFRGKKVVIFATGPTSKYYKPIQDAIHIGLNFAWRREDISLDYLFNTHCFNSDVNVEDGFNKIAKKVFVARVFDETTGNRHPESISFFNDKVVRVFFKHCRLSEILYQDICHHPLPVFASVAFPALAFALFTSPEKIYLVGCDVTNNGHFYTDSNPALGAGNDSVENTKHRWKVAYARFKLFAEQYYPETEIISINPVGLKGLFTDIYTDEYKAETDEDI